MGNGILTENGFHLSIGLIGSYLRKNKVKILKQLRIIIPYLLVYILFLFFINTFDISTESVRAYFSGMGAFLVPMFVGMQMLASLTPLPDLPFTAAGVLFFQPWASLLMIWAGMLVASIINFYLARRLGREFVHRKYPQTSEWMDKFAGRYGFEAIIVARNFTFVTFDLVAYAAGVSKISVLKFALASVFGLFPVALNATLVGLALTSNDIIRSFAFFILTGCLALIIGYGARRYRILQESRAVRRASKV